MMNFYLFLFMYLNSFMVLIMLIPTNLFKFHPLSLSLLLILYSLIICIKMNFFKNNMLYSYILFLVMVGGLMILFMYFTSLASNQLFYFKNDLNFYLNMKYLYYFMLMNVMIYLNCFWGYFMINYYSFEINNLMFLNMNFLKFFYIDLFKDFCLMMNLYMIMYLFLIMFCSVLICLKTLIPLQQLNKI